ncbi:MAG TPA: PHP domain-containing protein [Longimicrobium sp.]|nr:PHP domain-containing protein [Longimicrobium sp.]
MPLLSPPSFARFRDLAPADVNVDLQIHTDQTDGEASVEQVLAAAAERGLAAIAFTEHVRYSTDWFDGFAARIRRESQRFPGLDTFVGCEAKALDDRGGFDCPRSILDACDIVLGSVHRLPDGKGGFLRFEEMPPDELAEMECEYALGLMRSAPIHVLAHPGGMYQRHFGVYPEPLFRRMMEVSEQTGVAVEINSSYLRDVDAFLRLCQELNPYVSVGSDAHRLDELGRCRDTLLRTPWFTA